MGGSSSIVCGRCGTTFQSEHALSTHLQTCAILVHEKGGKLDVKATGDILVKTVDVLNNNQLKYRE